MAAVARACACRLGPSRPILAALGRHGPRPSGTVACHATRPARSQRRREPQRRRRGLGQVTRRLLRGWASASASPDCPRTQSPQRGRAQAGAVGPIPRPGGRGGGVVTPAQPRSEPVPACAGRIPGAARGGARTARPPLPAAFACGDVHDGSWGAAHVRTRPGEPPALAQRPRANVTGVVTHRRQTVSSCLVASPCGPADPRGLTAARAAVGGGREEVAEAARGPGSARTPGTAPPPSPRGGRK